MDFKQRYETILNAVLPLIPDSLSEDVKLIAIHKIKALTCDHILYNQDQEFIKTLQKEISLMNLTNHIDPSQNHTKECNATQCDITSYCDTFMCCDTTLLDINRGYLIGQIRNSLDKFPEPISIDLKNMKDSENLIKFWNMVIDDAFAIYDVTNTHKSNKYNSSAHTFLTEGVNWMIKHCNEIKTLQKYVSLVSKLITITHKPQNYDKSQINSESWQCFWQYCKDDVSAKTIIHIVTHKHDNKINEEENDNQFIEKTKQYIFLKYVEDTQGRRAYLNEKYGLTK